MKFILALFVALLATSAFAQIAAPSTAPADAPADVPEAPSAPVDVPSDAPAAPVEAPISSPETPIEAPSTTPEAPVAAPTNETAPTADGFSIHFTGNVSLNLIQQDHYQFRASSMGHLDVGSMAYRGWFKSVNVKGTGNAGVETDALWGEIFGGALLLPACYVSYYTNEMSTADNFTTNFNRSVGLIGGIFRSLREIDASGNEVKYLDFLGGLGVGLIWEATDMSDADGEPANNSTHDSEGLHWVTLRGTKLGEPWEILITFIVTDRVGVVNLASTVVNPRSVETIVEIKGWQYQNDANKLRLTLGVCTSGGVLTDENRKLNSGVGPSHVYAALKSEANIDGNNVDLSIDAKISTDFSLLGVAAEVIKSAIEEVYGDLAQFAEFNIDFTAGAKDIIWDPTFGQGDILEAEPAVTPSGTPAVVPGTPNAPGSGAASLAVASVAVATIASFALLL